MEREAGPWALAGPLLLTGGAAAASSASNSPSSGARAAAGACMSSSYVIGTGGESQTWPQRGKKARDRQKTAPCPNLKFN